MVLGTRVAGTVQPTNIDTTASLVAFMNVNGITGVSAVFVSGSSLLDAGTVTVRTNPTGGDAAEVPLDRLSIPYAGQVQYAYSTLPSHPVGISIPTDGIGYQRITVGGTQAWPAFADSVCSVIEPQLDSPANGSGQSRMVDLTVSWSDPGTDSTVYVLCALISNSDASVLALGTLARDAAGSATIAWSRLVRVPVGAVTLAVTRYRLVYHTVGGWRVGLASLGTATRHITIV